LGHLLGNAMFHRFLAQNGELAVNLQLSVTRAANISAMNLQCRAMNFRCRTDVAFSLQQTKHPSI